MTIDLSAAIRRRKPERRLARLKPRPLNALLALSSAPQSRLVLVPDTNVYVADAAGTLPAAAVALLDRALLFHCSVCLAELATGVANGDPKNAHWKATRDHYAEFMKTIPDTRVLGPSQDIWLDAGVLAGTLSRTQGFQPHQRKDILNDALIFLTATRAGYPILTSNRNDFDLLQQLAPEGRFYHY